MVNISTTAIWKKFILFLDVVLTILKIHFYKNMYQEKQNTINKYEQF